MSKLPKNLRTRVSNLMRRDLKKSVMANNARSKVFKGKSVYYCVSCETHYYTGKSDKNYNKLKDETYHDLKRCKESQFHLDHIDPVVPMDRTLHDMSLDEIALRVYCKEENIQYICEECHKNKSGKEMNERKEAGSLKRKK